MSFIDLTAQPRLYTADIMANFNKLLSTTTDPINVKFGDVTATGNILVSGDISTTVWDDYTPVVTGGGSMTISATTITKARWKTIGKLALVELNITVTTAGTGNTDLFVTLPLSPLHLQFGAGVAYDNTNYEPALLFIQATGGLLVLLSDASAWTIGAGRQVRCSFFYEIA